ncbi:hypothetical protein GCM10010329_18450 [Streptomyces spiroverticillatus]|uniref:ABC transporter permease n=1 Tax=Streptomyces finlayi TaxID=67296 RepID=A0A918WTQ8_9ACTN|nr:ABC transporter permease [Streptomyces finlayi]GGZ97461.1 hypothetical protein GCM10010329_18450 [Streptomyces spiroverticillatus]GHC82588.1 hypothetical protein GCM10010334_10930 [Streptomyces finlayi]
MSGTLSAVRVQGPTRLVLRQSRAVVLPAAVLLGLGVLAAGVMYLVGADDGSPLRTTSRSLTEYTAYTALLLPLLIGALVAGPLVARELESGTYRLAWTQGMSPARWLAAKAGVAAGAAVAASVLLLVVFRLGQGTAEGVHFQWHQAHAYAASGTAGIACALLGVAVGTLTALLVRRTLPAMGVAAVATGAVMLAVGQVRQYLWPAMTVTVRESPELRAGVLPSHWETSSGMVTDSGRRLDWEGCWSRQAAETYSDPNACMTARGAVEHFSDVHPASHFWPLQLVEAGVVLALAAGTVWLAFRVLRRLHG